MKKFLLSITFAALALSASAQKESLMIDYFSASNRDVEVEHVIAIRDHIVAGAMATGRLSFIDVDTQQTLRFRDKYRAIEGVRYDFEDRMDKMRIAGADYVLSGNVDKINIDSSRSENGKPKYFYAKIHFTLKITEMATGHLLATETITVNNGLFGSGDTRGEAFDKAVDAIVPRMKVFIDDNFPLGGELVELKESKKGKVISCYISLGEAHGMSVGQTFEVYQEKSIAGRVSQLLIGTLKLDSVIGDDISECKVTKGGDLIYNAFNAGDHLNVKSTSKSTINWGL